MPATSFKVDPLETLLLASIQGDSYSAYGQSLLGTRASIGTTSIAHKDSGDGKLRAKKPKLDSGSSDDGEVLDEEIDATSDEEKVDFPEDEEDDDFFPYTEAVRAAGATTRSSSLASTGGPRSPPSEDDTGDGFDMGLHLVETRKRRHRTTPEQLRILESAYRHERMPSLELREKLAHQLNMTPRRVQIWFQNKRAKDKRMRVSIKMQLGKSMSSKSPSVKSTDRSSSSDIQSRSANSMVGMLPVPRVGVQAQTTSILIPVRTPDGKVAYAAIPSASMGQGMPGGQMIAMQPGGQLGPVTYAAPMGMQLAAGMPQNQMNQNGSPSPQQAMYLNQMMAAQSMRYPMQYYGWPGADPSMQMWQAQLMAAQQPQAQMLMAQMMASGGAPKVAVTPSPPIMAAQMAAPRPMPTQAGSLSVPGTPIPSLGALSVSNSETPSASPTPIVPKLELGTGPTSPVPPPPAFVMPNMLPIMPKSVENTSSASSSSIPPPSAPEQPDSGPQL